MSGRDFKRLDENLATTAAVAQAMGDNGVVHFACHAIQDPNNPTKRGFLLEDGRLSTCQTATGEENLPDESVHLAAGMMVAGYPSVVATMWSIRDVDAPRVAQAFYRRLLNNDGEMIADALHSVISDLREVVGEEDFVSWAPFIHFGY